MRSIFSLLQVVLPVVLVLAATVVLARAGAAGASSISTRPAAQAALTCPPYDSIRDPSVDASKFSIDEIKGLWYLQATTEPTTRFCKCKCLVWACSGSAKVACV